jgi:predicted DNA-binding transcriptional regulator AlpA
MNADYLTRPEVANVLQHITTRTLQRWEAAKIGPPVVRLGPKRAVYPRAQFNEWLAARGADFLDATKQSPAVKCGAPRT